jgi:hypothetical protein
VISTPAFPAAQSFTNVEIEIDLDKPFKIEDLLTVLYKTEDLGKYLGEAP